MEGASADTNASITGLKPTNFSADREYTVTITGAGLDNPTDVSIKCAACFEITQKSGTEFNVKIKVDPEATKGNYDVIVQLDKKHVVIGRNLFEVVDAE